MHRHQVVPAPVSQTCASPEPNIHHNRAMAPTVMRPEATYTPICRLLSRSAKPAPSRVRTAKMPRMEARMPNPARAMGAAARRMAKPAAASVRPSAATAAAAPRERVASETAAIAAR